MTESASEQSFATLTDGEPDETRNGGQRASGTSSDPPRTPWVEFGSGASHDQTSVRWAGALVLVGIMIAIAHMVHTAVIVQNTGVSQQPFRAEVVAMLDKFGTDTAASAERSEIRSLAVTSSILGSEHTTRAAGLSFASSLLAIGFALFVMGVQSAFRASGTNPALGSITLKATAPGLVCFVLASVIVSVALLKPSKIQDPSRPTPAIPARDSTTERKS